MTALQNDRNNFMTAKRLMVGGFKQPVVLRNRQASKGTAPFRSENSCEKQQEISTEQGGTESVPFILTEIYPQGPE